MLAHVLVVQVQEVLRVHDRVAEVRRGAQHVHEPGRRTHQVEGDLVRVEQPYLFHRLEALFDGACDDAFGRVQYPVERGDYVQRGELNPIVPFRALSEREGVGQPVVGDLPPGSQVGDYVTLTHDPRSGR